MSIPKVAILGASGYTGQELRRLLTAHPGVELAACMTARANHTPPSPTLPTDPEILPLDLDASSWADSGYTGWVEYERGKFLAVNYINDDAPLAQIRGYRFGLEDF